MLLFLPPSAPIYLSNEKDDDDDDDDDGDGDDDGNVADDDDDDDNAPRGHPYLFFARKWLQRHSRSPITF